MRAAMCSISSSALVGPPAGGSKLATQPTCIGANGLSTARKEASRADRRSGMEAGKPIRLLLQSPPVGGAQPAERREMDPALLVPPRAGDLAVDQEGRERVRRLDAEDLWPVLLGEDAGAARVDEQRRVPGRQEPRRRRRLGVRQQPPRNVEQQLLRV